MGLGELFITIFLVIYTLHLIDIIIHKDMRKSIQYANKKLDNYRKKPIKTIDEQKEFISLKYPKNAGNFKFNFKTIFGFILYIIKFISLIKLYTYLLYVYFGLQFNIWQSLLIIIILTYLFNKILSKFNLQKGGLHDVINIGGK